MSYIEQIELEQLMISSMRCISGLEESQLGRNMKIEARRREDVDALVIQLWTYALTEKFEPVKAEAIVKVPKTWWDHFKMTYLSKWLAYKTVDRKVWLQCTPYAIYPKLPAFRADCGPTIKLFKQDLSQLRVDEIGESS